MSKQSVDRAQHRVVIVGGGLAGCEAAWQAATRGLDVVLYEMRPGCRSPAHQSDDLAELVCSNSLRSNQQTHAVGLLKEEMRRLGSLVLAEADRHAVPAGRALAVDRIAFARAITEAIGRHPRIEVRHELLRKIPDDEHVILATGPLTAPDLAEALQQLLGERSLYFYDSIAPVVYADSIDPNIAFWASRWEEGEGDYLNLPLTEAHYSAFVERLLEADTVPLHAFEDARYFEGCLPIEEIARRGRLTLAHGPMKPVGLVDPRTGRRPFAVVQLRSEDRRGVLMNLVGFQTKMKIAAQREVFRTLPGLAEAAFARFGSVHRNTYVNAPRHLTPTLEVATRPGLAVAGQLAGVEGYVESAALGGLAGIFAVWATQGRTPPLPPPATAHGSLLRHLREADPNHFQPMNASFGLIDPLPDASGALGAGPQAGRKERGGTRRRSRRERKLERYRRVAERALVAWDRWCGEAS